jgi:hypothetical protein
MEIMPPLNWSALMVMLEDWLDDRLEERRSNLVPATDPFEYAMLAGALRAQAITHGYRVEALEDLCGGDITSYLMLIAASKASTVRSALPSDAQTLT